MRVRSRAQHACRLEGPHASQSCDLQPAVVISLSFNISPRRKMFWFGVSQWSAGFPDDLWGKPLGIIRVTQRSGSALTYTERLRPLLERYLKTLNVKVFLDAPCGDFNWMKYVTLPHGTGTSAGILSPPSSMICKKLWRYLGLWSREQVAAALGSSMPNRSI